MAPIILFAFGPQDSFFFYCPLKTIKSALCLLCGQWFDKHTDLGLNSHRANYAFTKTVPPRLHLPYSVCLGPGDNEYCAFYVDKENELHYSISLSLSLVNLFIGSFILVKHINIYQTQPDMLTSQTVKPAVDFFVAHFKSQPQDILQSRLVLGPANTFIAITPSGVRWNVARNDLMTARGYGSDGSGKRTEGARMTDAALGFGGAWWVRFENGRCNWDLAGGYGDLERLLTGGDVDPKTINVSPRRIESLSLGFYWTKKHAQYLALSPFSNHHFFLVYEGNKVRYSLPAAFAQQIGPVIDEYHASLVSATGVHIPTGGVRRSASNIKINHNELPPPYS
jgi:hypothetical protein